MSDYDLGKEYDKPWGPTQPAPKKDRPGVLPPEWYKQHPPMEKVPPYKPPAQQAPAPPSKPAPPPKKQKPIDPARKQQQQYARANGKSWLGTWKGRV